MALERFPEIEGRTTRRFPGIVAWVTNRFPGIALAEGSQRRRRFPGIAGRRRLGGDDSPESLATPTKGERKVATC